MTRQFDQLPPRAITAPTRSHQRQHHRRGRRFTISAALHPVKWQIAPRMVIRDLHATVKQVQSRFDGTRPMSRIACKLGRKAGTAKMWCGIDE